MFRLHRLVAPFGLLRLIAGALQSELPLVLNGAGLGFEMLNSLQRDGQVRGWSRT
jgi:hypothetical protein